MYSIIAPTLITVTNKQQFKYLTKYLYCLICQESLWGFIKYSEAFEKSHIFIRLLILLLWDNTGNNCGIYLAHQYHPQPMMPKVIVDIWSNNSVHLCYVKYTVFKSSSVLNCGPEPDRAVKIDNGLFGWCFRITIEFYRWYDKMNPNKVSTFF